MPYNSLPSPETAIRSSIFFERSDEPVAFTGLIEGEILSLVKALTQASEKAFKKDEGEIFENLHDFPISG
ncbi:hypothetical protein [Brucella intermedia]|uniref:hypothetical protein n=1 Tax=Brucella intermedia TaxID=94625 RepID=UPI001FFF95DE|nr:hypothetical protein [Brucella intermedia]